MSSVLSSLCDETEVVKKRKILAGKKIVREARVPKRERWSSYRALRCRNGISTFITILK